MNGNSKSRRLRKSRNADGGEIPWFLILISIYLLYGRNGMKEVHQHLFVCLFVCFYVCCLGRRCLCILHVGHFTSMSLCVHILLYTLTYVQQTYCRDTQSSLHNSQEATLCNNKIYVALRKAFLYWLTWCLSKLFHCNTMTMRKH